METLTLNTRPRRSRRASLSCMPSDNMDPEELKKVLTAAKTKEELYEEYKEEKEARLRAHKEAEEAFRKTVGSVELNTTSGLAEQEEEITTRVSLETFERPKVSRKQRRASMGVSGASLQILAPLEDYKLELEEIEPVAMPVSPFVSTPTFDGGIFTGGTWDGSAVADPNVMFSAESLAGWVTVQFTAGPLGMQLEPTIGDKACRVTGFMDTLGCPSQARASGKIKFDDVIVKVNGKIPASYEETLQMIAEGGQRNITFRPGFSYELVDYSAKLGESPKSGKKKKVGRSGRRASMSAMPSTVLDSPTDVKKATADLDYGYNVSASMVYGDSAHSHAESTEKPKKKSSRKSRRASLAAMPMPGLVSAAEVAKSEEAAAPEPVVEKKKSKRGRRASMTSMPPAAMPGLVSATEATVQPPAAEETAAVVKKEKKSKKKSDDEAKAEKKVRKSRRASMSALPSSNMEGILEDLKKEKKKKKKSEEEASKKKSKKKEAKASD